MSDKTAAAEPTGEAIENLTTQLQTDVSNALDKASNGDISVLIPIAEKYLLPVVVALLTIIVAYFVAAIVSRMASAPITKRVDETVGKFCGKLIFYSIMTFAFLGVLGRFGISVASFAAVIAAAGFAIGLAFQGTLSNFAAGVLLLVFRPFKVGDVVNAAGVLGIVSEIDLFTTAINTFDNRRIIVPNSSIAGSTIENISYHNERRVDVKVGIDYDACIKETRAALVAAVETLGDKVIQGEGREHAVLLMNLGDSCVDWEVRVWTQSSEFMNVKQALIEAIKGELDSKQIGIPYPQLDVGIRTDVGQLLKKVAN